VSDTPARDREWLVAAIDESRRCPPTSTAYSVGAIIVDGDGVELSRGYSRETDPYVHAEECALAKLTGAKLTGADLTSATIYSSLEPCSVRRFQARTCTELILTAGLRRVVFALREPPIFADCRGAELLHAAGVEVVEICDLADAARKINTSIIGARYSH
jgi:diaminohydroxyphosphoribosylaminopyrimidine deaminase / 5-amino-6-(5-phosphoribosylamino)uracil reductase